MSIKFNYKSTALIKDELIKKNLDYLAPEITKINTEISTNSNNYSYKYNSIYSFINLIDDDNLFKQVTKTVKEVKKLKPTVFILIGIGGSNLGTLAVLETIYGRFYNNLNNFEFNSKLGVKFYCLDTLDNNYLLNILEIAEQELKADNNIIVNIVTKSGTTTETLVNSLFFIDLIKKYKADYNKYIVVTTDKSSHLWSIAKKEKYLILEVPKLVGGRFSVFSAVSLFPLSFLNIDIKLLRLGAQQIKDLCLTDNNTNNSSFKNIASVSAAIIYEHYKQNKSINDLFIFSKDLLMLGNWYRQLMAESIGKDGIGITPTISLGTTDLHSMLQLYLAGPKDKVTLFLSESKASLKNIKNIKVPENTFLTQDLKVAGRSINFLKSTVLKGVKSAYKKEKRPFLEIILPQINELYLGQFLMFKMLEIVYLGKLLNINVFNQPEVEIYKKEAKKYLNKLNNS